MQICSYCIVGKIYGFERKWKFSTCKGFGLVLNKDKFTPLKCLFFCIVWISWADFGKCNSLLVHLLSTLHNPFLDVCEKGQPNESTESKMLWTINSKFYRYLTEVTRNCDHHVFKKIQTLTVLNTRRKTHTGERKLTNKFTINEKWLALQGKKPRCFLKSVQKIDPQD